jgi:HEAT repeat protein
VGLRLSEEHEMEPSQPAFDEATYVRSFGLKKKADREFVEGIIAALGKIDRALLPPPAEHPLAALISQGPQAIDQLLDLVEKGDERKQRDALDALAHVLLGTQDRGARERLKQVLKATDDVEVAALLEKTLAIAGDDATLIEQMRRLSDEDPAMVASAARLLGFGRYRPAVPVLKGLVSPERFYESRWVIWALGEIGDPAALPALEIALAHAFRVVDCLIAIGKIGQIVSIPKLTPHLTGISEQKDAAVRALAMILDKNREDVRWMGALRDQLAGMIERDLADPDAPLSGSTRFHMLLCLARLGHKLDESRVKRYLGVGIDEADARHVATLVSGRKQSEADAKVFKRAGPPRKK